MTDGTPKYIDRPANIWPYSDSRYVLSFVDNTPYLRYEYGLEMGISYRSVNDYIQNRTIPKDFFTKQKNLGLNVIELAPGLAEFMPKFSQLAQQKPTTIDMIEYDVITDLLRESLSICNPTQAGYVETLIDRAQAIMCDTNYLNCPMEKLRDEHPELAGTADMVVYFQGSTNVDTLAKDLKKWLLKK